MSFINKVIGPIVLKLPRTNRVERIWKLAQVDFSKRYYNDRLGLFWALLNPLFQIAIYYFVFTIVFQSQIENFPLFIFCGLLIWITFSESSKGGLTVINSKKYLIENIQFEKIDLFLSLVISVFLGLAFNFFIYILCSYALGIYLGINALFMVLIFLNVFILCVAFSMILATMVGLFKDIKHLWNIALLAGFFGSGIFFDGQRIIDPYPIMKFLNPFVGIIINTRNCLLYNLPPDFELLTINLVFGVCALGIGWMLFKKYSFTLLEKSL